MTHEELDAIRERHRVVETVNSDGDDWTGCICGESPVCDAIALLAHIDAITEAERRRLADALRRYFEDGPSTFRGLLDYIDLDYATAQLEGWLDFNNAIVRHDAKVASGERE